MPRKIHLQRQGIHSAKLHAVAGPEHGRLRIPDFLYPSSVLQTFCHRSTRQLALVAVLQPADRRIDAIHNGYTIAWGSDVSETGFTRNGIAVMPDVKQAEDLVGSDAARWLGLSNNSKRAEIVKKLTSKPLPEVKVTQEMRQTAYDNWETTDDHGMQIYGIAKDQNGKEYYMVKNSWGDAGTYKGIWYASKAFVAYKTMNIVVNKNAIPEPIRKKLGLN